MDQTSIEQLKSTFLGEIIVPGDSGYDEASKVMFGKGEPQVIVRPQAGEDIAAAIAYAQTHELEISVRSGGHSGAGLSTGDGLVVDLLHFDTVEVVDEAARVVRIGAGARWGDVAHALAKHGWAISSGDTKSVGVGGLTLGGGIGWMVRKYGLAIDSLIAVELVTADGKTVRASATRNPDLFWALRGGGGNFGIATHFEFTAQPALKVYAGPITYERGTPDDVALLLKGWRDVMRQASDDLTTIFLLMPEFMGRPPAVMVLCCYVGNEAAGKAALEPLLRLGTVVKNGLKEKNYADVLEEAHPPAGVRIITNDVFLEEFSDAAIETIAQQEGTILQIRSMGGAMSRVASDATAFAHRDSEVLVVSPTFAPLDSTPEDITKALTAWRAIAPFGKGAYPNFFTETDGAVLAASYPTETLARLAEIKQQYDPQNIFHRNLNIKPASE